MNIQKYKTGQNVAESEFWQSGNTDGTCQDLNHSYRFPKLLPIRKFECIFYRFGHKLLSKKNLY